jgi:predicted RNA methylase
VKRRGAGQSVAVAPMLFADEERDVSTLSQWYTSPKAARALHDFAAIPAGSRVLEPSAGRGALILPRPDLRWLAIDIDPANIEALGRVIPWTSVAQADFLALSPPAVPFDFAVMNPPFENGGDLAHVLHALDYARRVVTLIGSDFEHGAGRYAELWRWIDEARGVSKLTFVNRPFKGAMSDFVVWSLPGRRDDGGDWRRPGGPRDPLVPMPVAQCWGWG